MAPPVAGPEGDEACASPADTEVVAGVDVVARCVLPPTAAGATFVRVVEAPWWLDVEQALVIDGGFDVAVPDPDVVRYGWIWAFDVDLPGVGHTRVHLHPEGPGRWSCSVDPVRAFAVVSGIVHGAAGREAWVEACERRVQVGPDGRYTLAFPAGACTVVAHAGAGCDVDGPGDRVDVDAAPGEQLTVDFVLPGADSARVEDTSAR